jgi:hypothetical protein
MTEFETALLAKFDELIKEIRSMNQSGDEAAKQILRISQEASETNREGLDISKLGLMEIRRAKGDS